jgi:predicted pyridoxine 5'-phosphate oxidase superfamily flavin-nucleotide-binding protein
MIESLDALRALYPAASARSLAKQTDRLDETMRRFVAHAPLCVIASVGAGGALADASPRGGLPGFVQLGCATSPASSIALPPRASSPRAW